MTKLLIIEDNQDVNKMLCEFLCESGYETESAYTGTQGLEKIKNNTYDLILLDLMLPYISGDQILKEVRTFSEVPIIIISAKDLVGTKIDLLKLGADDYITKPFDLNETVARIESNLRRYKRQNNESIFRYKDITLEENGKRVIVGKTELDLTSKEYYIMELLIKNKTKVFTKSNLYETIWKEDYIGDDNAVKTHISNLRNKLKSANSQEEYIETVWGLGYRLFKEP